MQPGGDAGGRAPSALCLDDQGASTAAVSASTSSGSHRRFSLRSTSRAAHNLDGPRCEDAGRRRIHHPSMTGRRRVANLVALALSVILLGGACSSPDPARAKADAAGRGDELYAAGRYADAAVAYRRALGADTSDGQVQMKLALAYRALGPVAAGGTGRDPCR